MATDINRRILLVDDNPQLHADYRKILGPQETAGAELDALAGAFFGEDAGPSEDQEIYELDSAHQGQEALQMLREARRDGHPYAMAFIDVRMPPGWDGIETLARLWKEDPDLQAVLCTAFSDYSYEQMLGKLGRSQNLLILKKPFDTVEVQQLASALTQKWSVTLAERLHLEEVRAYAASLETVNHALASDKAMAQAFQSDHQRFVLSAVRTLERAGGILQTFSGAQGPGEVPGQGFGRALEEIEHVAECIRLEAGARAPSSPCCIPDLIEELRSEAQRCGVEFSVRSGAGLPRDIRTDGAALRGCLRDLVHAARDGHATGLELGLDATATRPGEWHLRIDGRLRAPAGENLQALPTEGEPFAPQLEATCQHLVVLRFRCRHVGIDCQVEPGQQGGLHVVMAMEVGAVADGGERIDRAA